MQCAPPLMCIIIKSHIVPLQLAGRVASAIEVEVKLAVGLLLLVQPAGLVELGIFPGLECLLLGGKLPLFRLCRFRRLL